MRSIEFLLTFCRMKQIAHLILKPGKVSKIITNFFADSTSSELKTSLSVKNGW